MRVFDLQMGDIATITKIDVAGSARERLYALGVKEGEKIEVISFSLLKSSVLISCNAVRIGLRRSMAQRIEVER